MDYGWSQPPPSPLSLDDLFAQDGDWGVDFETPQIPMNPVHRLFTTQPPPRLTADEERPAAAEIPGRSFVPPFGPGSWREFRPIPMKLGRERFGVGWRNPYSPGMRPAPAQHRPLPRPYSWQDPPEFHPWDPSRPETRPLTPSREMFDPSLFGLPQPQPIPPRPARPAFPRRPAPSFPVMAPPLRSFGL